jgi:hypothetical protein
MDPMGSGLTLNIFQCNSESESCQLTYGTADIVYALTDQSALSGI